MKLGVSSYSFHKLMEDGTMDIFDILKVAKLVGFDSIEFTELPVPEGEDVLAFAENVSAACREIGIEISNYTVWADFMNGSGGDTAREVKRVKELVNVAHALGAKGMRHDATWGFRDHSKGRNFDDALRIIVPGIREVTEHAAKLGIRTMCENHGFFAQDSERMEKLVLAVDHENFGLLVDMGNFLCADENPIQAVSRVAPYAFHVHAKDFLRKPGMEAYPGKGWFRSRGGDYLRGTITGHGIVPVGQCIDVLQRAGYDGIVSLEFEGLEETLEAVEAGFEYLKKFV